MLLELLLIVGAAVQAPNAAAGQASAVLERRPAGLPPAAADAWSDWDPARAPQGDLRERFAVSVSAYQRGDLPAALAATYAVLEAHPDYPPSLHQMGVVYFRLRRYGDAIVAFERLLLHAPGEIAETRALGHCYYSLARYDDAERHYEAALAAAPDMLAARRGYGLVQMRLGRPERALAILSEVAAARAEQGQPPEASTLAWIAQLHYDLERVDEALAAATRARDADPFEPKPWFLLAKLHFDQGDDEAGEVCRARFEELDRVAQTVRRLEAELLLEPGDARRMAQLARALRARGDLQRCRRALARLVQTEPDNCAWRLLALECLSAMGDGEGTAWALAQLEERCAERVETWEFLETYYARTKNRIKQVEAGERARRLRGH